MVITIAARLIGQRLVVVVAIHQSDRRNAEIQANLPLPYPGDQFTGIWVNEHHRITGCRSAHRTELDGFARTIADRTGDLCLTVAVANGVLPGSAHLLDDLGIERFPRPNDFSGRMGKSGQVGLDEHPPHSGRGTETGDLVGVHDPHEGIGIEPGIVEDKDRRLGQEGAIEIAPGVLAPSGRRDVQVHVTGAHPKPVHSRQVPDGVTHMGVFNQLWA